MAPELNQQEKEVLARAKDEVFTLQNDLICAAKKASFGGILDYYRFAEILYMKGWHKVTNNYGGKN